MTKLTRALPFPAYLALDGLHISTLKSMAVSPKQYLYDVATPRQDTPAMLLGRVTHALTLTSDGPEDVPFGVAVYPGAARRGKEWDRFEADHAGSDIVTGAEMSAARHIARAVRDSRDAAALLRGGDAEVTLEWDYNGQRRKARPDYLIPATKHSRPILVELKTARDVTPEGFARDAATLLYHAQWGWYSHGVNEVCGARPDVFCIAAQNRPPWDVVVYAIPDDVIRAGDELADDWAKRVAECEAKRSWPGVGANGPIAFKLAPWAKRPALSFEDIPTESEGNDG